MSDNDADHADQDEFAFLFEELDSQQQPQRQEVSQPSSVRETDDEDFSFLYDQLTGGHVSGSSSGSGRVANEIAVGLGRGRGRGRAAKRGRPKGVTKILSEVFAEQSSADQANQDVGLVGTESNPGSIAYARQFRKSELSKSKSELKRLGLVSGLDLDLAESSPPSTMPLAVVLSSLQTKLSKLDASFLQRCVANAAWCGFQKVTSPTEFQDSLTMKLMKAPVGSNRLLASHFGMQENQFAEQATLVANALFESGHILWGWLLHCIFQAIESRQLIPLCIIRKFRYDETPLRNRVNVFDHARQQWVQDTSDHTKLFQTEFGLRMLCRKPDDGSFWLWSGFLPTLLQAVERTTAVCTRQCLEQILKSIPGLDQLATKFPYQVHLSTTDRYAANILAEKQLQSQNMAWVRSHFFCDSHRVAQAHSAAAKLVSQDTSGMLSTALCQRDMGSLATLREMLADILLSKLVVVYDAPPTGRAVTYRHQVFDMLLPLPNDLSRGRKDTKTLVRMKQRFVLGQLLNGDLESPEVIHYCAFGCCESFHQTEEKFKKWVCWALLPHKMPRYCQSRWTGQEAAVTWCSLLMAHHGLFEDLMIKFTGSPLLQGQGPLTVSASDDNEGFLEALAAVADQHQNKTVREDTGMPGTTRLGPCRNFGF